MINSLTYSALIKSKALRSHLSKLVLLLHFFKIIQLMHLGFCDNITYLYLKKGQNETFLMIYS